MRESENLKPVIKWAGGKEKELNHILSNIPADFDNYYEPFVGGGSVFLSIPAKHYFINDRYDELISLYRHIASQNNYFFSYLGQINQIWKFTALFFHRHSYLMDKYKQYRENSINDTQLKNYLIRFCEKNSHEIIANLDIEFSRYAGIVIDELEKNLIRKLKRMKTIELSKQMMPDKDISDNIETAIKSAYYMFFRHIYNDNSLAISNPELYCAIFHFIRNFCYSGMFRYNASGEFNVPYGGIAYNSKTLDRHISYYKSTALHGHLNKTDIYNLDFEEFLDDLRPKETDFIFLDPPYDSEFSTYARNEFTKNDQIRLADYLKDKCKAKWMLIIKDTDFIRGLYDSDRLNIKMFDKEYLVSFMNRNDKRAKHLLITNY